mmetsp:Transcript_37953/g.79480  ORF Transcript_37953/g.79480 Transcript_37953/m.79480 type:complete len:118 (-) Transcript_37953:169-522(-)
MNFVHCSFLFLAFVLFSLQITFAISVDDLHSTVTKMRDLSHEKYTKSHKKFRFFDTDSSESISREEFMAGLTKLGYKTSTKKLDHIMNELDINQDGRVEFVEFMRPTAKKVQRGTGT